jgi:hypothetical protein
MQRDDRGRRGETEPWPSLARSCGVASIKWLEQVRQDLVGHTGPVILDHERGFRTLGSHRDLDSGPRWSVPACVVENLVQDHPHQANIGPNQYRLRRLHQADRVCTDPFLRSGYRLPGQDASVNLGQIQGDLAGLEPS